MDRRSFLAAGALAGVAGGLGPLARDTRASMGRIERGSAKNVIFLVSDGMSFGTLGLADALIQLRDNRPSHWSRLWEREGAFRALQVTSSVSGYVTDSAAAATAWSIGSKVRNSAICWTPNDEEPEPLLIRAKRAGKATGCVTTTRITHATPAAFFANVPDRSLERGIAEQLLERKIDVALGGGAKHFPDHLFVQHPGARVVRTRRELQGVRPDETAPLVGLFNHDHLSYVLDRSPEEPTLVEMTEAALDRLSRNPDGFVLQVEGGRVDHAAHANDAGAMLTDQIEFDDAIDTALRFAEGRDDTLVIVTTDHGNANPGLTYYGEGGNERFARLLTVRHSFEWMARQAAANPGSDPVELIREAMGVTLTDEERSILERAMNGRERVDPFELANELNAVIGSLLANHFGVAFLSPNHTADPCEVTAIGPGADALPAYVDNTDLHTLVVETLGIESTMPVGG